MKRRHLGFLMIFLFSLALTTPSPSSADMNAAAMWNFDVYIDDKMVGTHQFRVLENGDETTVKSEASFKYKFLFVTAYQYEHRADERWAGNCLVELDARTNANGKEVEVSGERSTSGFVVDKSDTPTELPHCVMTFAYWNPEFLQQSRLLNPQTGEYLDVNVEKIGSETLDIQGESVAATRFSLTAEKLDLTLWYSDTDKWLALESVAKGGRIIRYELS